MCPFSDRRAITNDFITLATGALLCAMIAAIAGCGDKSEKTASAKTAANASTDAPSSTAGPGDLAKSAKQSAAGSPEGAKNSPASKSQTSPRAELDNTPRTPATVEEAQRVLDLTTFPLPDGVQIEGQRSIALLRYRTAGADVKSAFDFVRQKFTERGWKETGETYLTAESASGTFGGKGFHATVSAYPDSSKPDSKAVNVSITNQGNLNLATLPVPPGAKRHYSNPTGVGYVTEMSIDAAAEAVGKLLAEQGWTPYGDNIGMKIYKQNAIELKVSVSAMPQMEGKNMISFFPSLMSADLPPPPMPISVTYTDYMSPPKQLMFESSASHENLYKLYGETLAKADWKPTTDNPIKEDRKWFMIFRNPAKDLLELETYDQQPENKIRGTLKHQSAAELAEIERQIELDRPRREAELKRKLKEEADKKAQREKEERDKEAAEKERRRVVVSLPGDAKDLTFEPDVIKFTPARGNAKAAAQGIAKQFRDRGWKEGTAPMDPTVGTYKLEREDQRVIILYSDTRLSPSEVRVSGFRVDFARPASAEKK